MTVTMLQVCNSYKISTAAAYLCMSASFLSLGLLDVLYSGALSGKPCIHAHIRRLATKPREKCGF